MENIDYKKVCSLIEEYEDGDFPDDVKQYVMDSMEQLINSAHEFLAINVGIPCDFNQQVDGVYSDESWIVVRLIRQGFYIESYALPAYILKADDPVESLVQHKLKREVASKKLSLLMVKRELERVTNNLDVLESEIDRLQTFWMR
jgi:hypothetical protein